MTSQHWFFLHFSPFSFPFSLFVLSPFVRFFLSLFLSYSCFFLEFFPLGSIYLLPLRSPLSYYLFSTPEAFFHRSRSWSGVRGRAWKVSKTCLPLTQTFSPSSTPRSRTASVGSAAGTSTRAPPTRLGARSRTASPPWRVARAAWRSPPAWQPKTPWSGCCAVSKKNNLLARVTGPLVVSGGSRVSDW